MTDARVEEVAIAATPGEIRAILGDADRLGRVFPGCESAAPLPDGRASFVVANRIGFMTVRADVIATTTQGADENDLRLVLDGRTRGLDGTFRAAVDFTLIASGAGTTVRYALETEAAGAVAMLGEAGLESSIREQIGALVANVEREAAAGR